jgi:hypothetical protein
MTRNKFITIIAIIMAMMVIIPCMAEVNIIDLLSANKDIVHRVMSQNGYKLIYIDNENNLEFFGNDEQYPIVKYCVIYEKNKISSISMFLEYKTSEEKVSDMTLKRIMFEILYGDPMIYYNGFIWFAIQENITIAMNIEPYFIMVMKIK